MVCRPHVAAAYLTTVDAVMSRVSALSLPLQLLVPAPIPWGGAVQQEEAWVPMLHLELVEGAASMLVCAAGEPRCLYWMCSRKRAGILTLQAVAEGELPMWYTQQGEAVCVARGEPLPRS